MSDVGRQGFIRYYRLIDVWVAISIPSGFVLDGVGERRCINMACDLASQSLLVSFHPIVLVVKSERGYGGKFNVEIIHPSGDQRWIP